MIDNYGRNIDYIRISITELCNLRCEYCMPAEGIRKRSHDEMMTAEETIEAVRAAVSLGISKVRITGGEPLVKRGVVRLCEAIARIDGVEELCVTTNGTLLPEYGKALREAGVSRVNISLDTLKPDRYRKITRIGDLEDAQRGIDAAFEAGFDKIKINNVLIGGFNDDEIADFVGLTMDRPLDVRFIELMPIGDGMDHNRKKFISCDEVPKRVPALEKLNDMDGVADMYRLPGAGGKVGLIRTISCGFCDRCNRIRLTADGMLKPCLHSEAEHSIRGKTPEEIKRIMEDAILQKPKERDVLDADNPSRSKRHMHRIGG